MSSSTPARSADAHGPRTLRGQRVVNLLVRALLATPGVSRGIGRRLVTVYAIGRKSRKRYAIPVAYHSRGDDLLVGTGFAWARNLRTGQPVEIRLRGRRRWADVRVDTDETAVTAAYLQMATDNTTFAGFNRIRIGADGEPDAADIRLAWQAGARLITLTPRFSESHLVT